MESLTFARPPRGDPEKIESRIETLLPEVEVKLIG
jgi:hypothetical protein